MFASRLKDSSTLFNVFLIVEGEDKSASYIYPTTENIPLVNNIRDFAFPCKHRSQDVEEYTLIFTDGESNHDFVFCRYIPNANLCLCLSSCKPWFEILHSIVEQISQKRLFEICKRKELDCFLQGILELSLMDSSTRILIPKPLESTEAFLMFELPQDSSPHMYTKYFLEFFSAMDWNIWIDIFTSLLLERRTLFHANRLHRLTACILAVTSLIYPLNWVHLFYPILSEKMLDYTGCTMPFIAGVHSCHMDRVLPMLSEGTRVVDLDTGATYITNESVQETLPKQLKNFFRQKWMSNGMGTNISDAQELSRRIKDTYLQTMVAILGGYRNALVITNESGNNSVRLIKETFVESRGSDLTPFLTLIYESQMVRQFFEQRETSLESSSKLNNDFDLAVRNFNVKDLNISTSRHLKDNFIISLTKAQPVVKNALITVKDIAKKRTRRNPKSKISRSGSDPTLDIAHLDIRHGVEAGNAVGNGYDQTEGTMEPVRMRASQKWTLIDDAELQKVLRKSGSAQNLDRIEDPDVIPSHARRHINTSPPPRPPSPHLISLSPTHSYSDTSSGSSSGRASSRGQSTSSQPQPAAAGIRSGPPTRPSNPPNYQVPVIPAKPRDHDKVLPALAMPSQPVNKSLRRDLPVLNSDGSRRKPPPRPAVKSWLPSPNDSFTTQPTDLAETNPFIGSFNETEEVLSIKNKSASLGPPPPVPPKPMGMKSPPPANAAAPSLYEEMFGDFDPLFSAGSGDTSVSTSKQQQQQPDLLLSMDAHIPKSRHQQHFFQSPLGFPLPQPGQQPLFNPNNPPQQPVVDSAAAVTLRSVARSNSDMSFTSDSQFFTPVASCIEDPDCFDPYAPSK